MLKTEQRNQSTTHIDKMTTAEMLRAIQNENYNAARAVEEQLERIGAAVDAISERMNRGGRLFYLGCGTSGRLGVLDASECPPTYGVPHELVVGIIAGGDGALRRAVEGAEDSRQWGKNELSVHDITELDSVVGISVAGGAGYVIGALEYAKECGALTVALTSNEGSPIEAISDICICTDTGAEVITGSTRMKAGTAHKMVLNMISTSVMIKAGHVYENLMINLRPSNIKLKARMIRIVSDITGENAEFSEKLLEDHGFVIRDAINAYNKKENLQ